MHSSKDQHLTRQVAGPPLPAQRGTRLMLPLILAMVMIILSVAEPQASGSAFISDKAPEEGYQKLGDEFYAKRADGFKDGLVDSTMINKALASYHKAYALGDSSEELAVKLLRAAYFYATYAEKTKARQKKALTDAIEIGEEILHSHQRDVALNYHLAVTWGRWGEVNGIFSSARKGIADKVKDFGEMAERIDPSYAEGGAYRTLGRLHYKAPRIPLILTWPSKKESQEYLEKAVKIGPTNLTNHLFLAETLIANNDNEKALRHIDYILMAKVNPTRQVEDLQDKKDAQLLKDKISGR